MAPINEATLEQRLKKIGENKDYYISRLHERGIESCILLPLIELLGFDPLDDVEYEDTSKSHHERFDFLLGNKVLIEAKCLSVPVPSM